MLYRLKDGSHTRGEQGRKVRYKAGTADDIMTLTDAEAHQLRARIEPYAGPAPAPAPAVEAKAPAAAPAPAPPPSAPRHAETAPEGADKPPPLEPPPPAPWDELLTGNVGHVADAIAKLDDPEKIREIIAAEKLGKDRSGVYREAEQRITALENPEGGEGA